MEVKVELNNKKIINWAKTLIETEETRYRQMFHDEPTKEEARMISFTISRLVHLFTDLSWFHDTFIDDLGLASLFE